MTGSPEEPEQRSGGRTTALAAEYEITPEDWEAVNAAHIFDSPLYVDLTRKSRIVGGLLFATLSLFTLTLGSGTGALLFALAGPPFVYFVGPLQRKAQVNSLNRLRKQGISHGLFGPHRIEIREEGLFHATSAHETLIRWHAIDHVREIDGHLLVYTGPNAFLPVPITAFPDADRLRAFAHAFHERLGAHRPNERAALRSGGAASGAAATTGGDPA